MFFKKHIKSLILFFLLFFSLYIINIDISASTKKFIWDNLVVKVPFGSDISNYSQIPSVKLEVDGVIVDNYIELEKGAEGTTLSIVNTNLIGSYKVIYKAISYDYNYRETINVIFIVYDATPPFIYPMEDIKTNVGEEIDLYKDFFYFDNSTEESLLKTNISLNNYTNEVVGIYTITYEVIDQNLNSSSINRIIEVEDNIPPSIYFIGSNKITINDSSFNLLDKIKVIDNYTTQNSISIEILLNEINTQKIGKYKVLIKVSDEFNNYLINEYIFEVIDNIPPSFELYSNTINLEINSNQNLLDNITNVSDNYSLNTTFSIEGFIDLEKPGIYELTYICKDEYSNESKKNVKVIVGTITSPVIVQILDEITNLDVFNPFDFVKAYDFKNKDISNKLVLVKDNYIEEPGTYYIIFEVYDTYLNFTKRKIYFNVIESNSNTTSIATNTNLSFPDNDTNINTSESDITIENTNSNLFNSSYVILFVLILIVLIYFINKKTMFIKSLFKKLTKNIKKTNKST